MTQIKKTLSIAGIIALVTAPAMAEIASTQYVQNALSSITLSLENLPIVEDGPSGVYGDSGAVLTSDGEGGMMWRGGLEYTQSSVDGTLAIGGATVGSIMAGGSTALGVNASTFGDDALAIGSRAHVGTENEPVNFATIQLGDGTNTSDGTFQVWNHTLLDYEGLIPAGRLTGQTNGVDNNGVENQLLASDGNGGMKWVNAPSVPEGTLTNAATGEGALAIGNDASATGEYSSAINGSASGYSSIAIGDTDMFAHASGGNDIAIGADTYANGGDSVAIGYGPQTNSGSSIAFGHYAYVGERSGNAIAIGYGAEINDDAPNAIQLGGGSNDVAGTFNVGFGYNATTHDYDNYTLLESDGKIPYERFAPTPDATCRASVGQKCALVVTWDGSEYSQSWEVVRSTSSGQ